MFTNHWDALKYALQALAQPCAFQQRLLDVWLQNAGELPERLIMAERHLVRGQGALMTKEQQEALATLRARFESFCGQANAEHWEDDALAWSSHWSDVRRLAAQCLAVFGWPLAEPPLEVAAYGDDYYEQGAG
jgi:hypothetical protein